MSSRTLREIPYPDPPLTDGVFTVRPLCVSDAPAIVALHTDESVRIEWLVGAAVTEDEARAQIAQADDERKSGRLRMAIADTGGERLVGMGRLYREGHDGGIGEIGIVLARHAQGRGLAFAAALLLFPWAFRGLGFRRLQALTHPENETAVAVLTRLGFKPEGHLRSLRGPGPDGDRVIFSLLPSDLAAMPGDDRPDRNA
jgi:[ribosomal protein S5]-alanine N-acetyltransferase